MTWPLKKTDSEALYERMLLDKCQALSSSACKSLTFILALSMCMGVCVCVRWNVFYIYKYQVSYLSNFFIIGINYPSNPFTCTSRCRRFRLTHNDFCQRGVLDAGRLTLHHYDFSFHVNFLLLIFKISAEHSKHVLDSENRTTTEVHKLVSVHIFMKVLMVYYSIAHHSWRTV